MSINTDKEKLDTDSKKRRKMALGRGLDSLIPTASDTDTDYEKNFFLCDIELIRPNRYQPRRRFDETELAELRDSIREQGILQPLLVRKEGLGFELVAGERRLRASKLAGLKQVPVVIKEVTDAELLEMSLIENIQREDLNPLDEAEAYHLLMTEFSLTQEAAAQRVGKSRSSVANSLRLRQLPDPIKETILDNSLSMGHARALLGTETSAQQLAAWRTVMSKGLSVRQTEALIRQLKRHPKTLGEKTKAAETIYLQSLAEELTRRFGTRVNIHRRGKRGKVEIDFFSDDDLNRLLELLQRI